MHEHDHNCGCGHDHDHEPMITLTLDDDTELDCIVMCIFPVNENNYIALLPADSADDEESEIYLYQYIEHEDDDVELLNIESDDEFEEVSRAFDTLLEEDDEYNELLDDEFFDDEFFDDEDDFDEEDEY